MSRRLPRAIVMGACALLLAAGPARAQDVLARLIGQPIVAVELQVEGRPETSPSLLALVDIKPGDRLTIEATRRVVAQLIRVPRFESVRVLADERPEGLVVIFSLEPRHPIDRLEFGGETGVPVDELDRLVREQFSGLPTLTRLSEVEDTVRRLLRNEGYRSAAVATETVQFHNPDRATLAVQITAGPRTTIARADVRGKSTLSPDRVIARLGAAPGSPFRERALATGLAEIRDDLRAEGFYTAIAQHQPEFSAGGTEVSLVFTIEAGPLVRLQINGELPGSVDDFVPIKRQGSLDSDLLDDSRVATESTLRRQGYWRARVDYTQSRPSPDQLLLTFNINRGKRYRVVRAELSAGLQVTAADLQAQDALKTGAFFSQVGVQDALLVIKAQYQQKGFHQVVMDPKYEEATGRNAEEGGVIVFPNITEGPRAVVTRIVFDLGDRPVVTEAELRRQMNGREQAPYVPANLVLDTRALLVFYESGGFLNRTVELRAEFSNGGTDALLKVFAREGPRIVVGEITVVGNERLSRDEILREITLRPGSPYSDAARVESQGRLHNLLSFKSVRITAEPRLPGETATRIIISVEEASSTTFSYGGGLEAGTHPRSVEGGRVEDRVEVAPRAFVEVGRRNLGGRNRAVNFFARVTAKPKDAPGDPEHDGRGFGFTEYRVIGTYRQRYAFQSETDVLVAVTSEQAIRTSFNFVRHSATAGLLRPLSPRVSVSGRYLLEVTELFDERISEEDQPLIDRLFPQVRLSIVSGVLFWDRRNDRISPSRGGQFSAVTDFALRPLGSEVGFVKTFLQASIFRPVTTRGRAIFAGRAQLGLARGFERRVPRLDEGGQPVIGPNGNQVVDVVADLPAGQRFFSGGSITVRGFQLDRLGVPEILDDNGLSNGGNGVVVLNGELRVKVGNLANRSVAVVGFVDAGNVFHRAGDLSLARLRATLGFGVRYDSPIGPLRLDFGFKTDRYVFANARERRWEFHLTIGEVF